jgi:hypothetical protein
MQNKQIISVLVEKLSKDFEITGSTLPVVDDYEKNLIEIRKHLIERIIVQMEKNFERFLNTLYRMDIDEEKLNSIIAKGDVADLPEIIADMIIERQLQRVKTQLLYKQGKL